MGKIQMTDFVGVSQATFSDAFRNAMNEAIETYGVKVGRTSHKLRNADNVGPEWAAAYVNDLVEDPTYLVGPNGELGALLPIKLKAECGMCHGPAEEIDESIMAAITEAYPDDQAVGFVEGDLRGWFWVEAPPGEMEAEGAEDTAEM